MGLTVQLTQIAKAYNGSQILADCSYTFGAGGVYILMGDNGTGKSTLFRIAALLEAPDQGEVRYLEGNEALVPDINLKRRVTMVFPRVGVFSRSVYENVAYGLKIRGMDHNLIREKVAKTLQKVGLAHKTNQPATTLSSGETMRLGLARALAIDPEILFLDEPTTHLDKANSKLIEDCLLTIRQERSLSMVIITHDASQANRLEGRKLLLSGGKIWEI
uniref:ATP-binding cassette domain-containing protein n=1 Tax=Desulfobacca acetoxidans TaxID=60893 RepID=A0A7C3WNT3_9BACT